MAVQARAEVYSLLFGKRESQHGVGGGNPRRYARGAAAQSAGVRYGIGLNQFNMPYAFTGKRKHFAHTAENKIAFVVRHVFARHYFQRKIRFVGNGKDVIKVQ